MSNVALIFAGGVGQRMRPAARPKQFLELHGKPIIIYTLEVFDRHPEIDGIVVACVDGWHEYLQQLLDKFHITKVKSIVPGGKTGQESIRNGIYKLHTLYGDDTVVLIHDGVRPLIDRDLLSRNIACARQYGNAITVAPAIETIAIKSDIENEAGQIIDRSDCQLLRAPQCFLLGDIMDAHRKAQAAGRNDYIDSACLMRDYGHRLHTVMGSSENIKITTPSDFYIFRAIIDARENGQVFG